MARVQIPFILQNTAGDGLANISVQIVNRNTGVLATVYTNESGGTLSPNPILSTTVGRIPGWVEEGPYTVLISSTGTTTITRSMDLIRGSGAGIVGTNAVTSAKIVTLNVTSAKFASGAVTSAKINTGAVTEPKMADNSVSTRTLAAGAVTTEMVTDAVGTAEIADGAVLSDALAASAATSTEILDGSVTNDKIADGAIGSAELASNAVTGSKVGSGAITSAKVANTSLTYTEFSNAVFPVGMLICWPDEVEPGADWLRCDGSAVARATYPALLSAVTFTRNFTYTNGSAVVTIDPLTGKDYFTGMHVESAAVGSSVTISSVNPNQQNLTLSANASSSGVIATTIFPYGGTVGTDFLLPDYRGRHLFGRDQASNTTYEVRAVGQSDGRTLTSRAPQHSHTTSISLTTTGSGHTHGYSAAIDAGPASLTIGSPPAPQWRFWGNTLSAMTGGNHTHALTGRVGSQQPDAPINTTPFLNLYYYIKAR